MGSNINIKVVLLKAGEEVWSFTQFGDDSITALQNGKAFRKLRKENPDIDLLDDDVMIRFTKHKYVTTLLRD